MPSRSVVVAVAATCVLTAGALLIVDRMGRSTIEYGSTVPSDRDEFIRAVDSLGYPYKETTNADGRPVVLVSGVSKSDAAKLDCVSLTISAKDSTLPELHDRMSAACAP